jgi:hypothetical protein
MTNKGIQIEDTAVVVLTPTEFHHAVNCALLQITASELDKRNHTYTMKRDRLGRLHHATIGAIGEIAFAKWMDRFFVPQINTFHGIPDCFEDVEVRASDKHTSLITRDDDAPDRKYVKVMTNGNGARIIGWLYGHETRQDKWFINKENQRPCWMVPHNNLRTIATIKDLSK